MVCQGPEPPENSPQNLTPPPRHELITNGHQDDSDEEQNDYFGYEPLPQGPEVTQIDHDNEEAQSVYDIEPATSSAADVPPIETMENAITREVWNSPRSVDPIEMDQERAQQVMSAMANFALPQTSIPDWAQSISEDQWKQTLNDRIEKLKGNR